MRILIYPARCRHGDLEAMETDHESFSAAIEPLVSDLRG
jgi:hypothetical protein